MARWFLATIVILWLAQPVRSELIYVKETIGYQMAGQDCVVRAVITKAELVPSPDPAAKSSDPGWNIQLQIHETIVALPAPTMTLFLPQEAEPEWAKDDHEQLFFLKTGTSASQNWPGITHLLSFVPWTAVDWPMDIAPENFHGPVITDDLRLLKSSDELLAEVRRLAQMAHPPNGSVTIMLPESVSARLGMDPWDWLEVALDDDAFNAARNWITSSDPQMQWCGAEVLVHQNSPQNAIALRHFLASAKETPRYGVKAKWSVLKTLNAWGIPDLPSLVTPTLLFNPRAISAWLSLAAWMFAPAVYIIWKKRRTRIWTVLWWITISAITVLGIRSYWPQDAVTRGDWDVALERGDLYIIHHQRATNGFPSPLLVCTPQALLDCQYAQYTDMAGQLSKDSGLDFGDLFKADTFAEIFWPRFMGSSPIPWERRLLGPDWQIPLWLILFLLLLPRLVLESLHLSKKLRGRRARGFPIDIVKTPLPTSP